MRTAMPLTIVLLLAAAARANSERPNILFIYADDQSYKTVGCYPEAWPWVKTPHIDAPGGVRHPVRAVLPGGVVHAVAGQPAHRAFAARHPVDADGGHVSRQHLRSEAVPVLAGRFSQAAAITRPRSASGTPAPTPASAATGTIRSCGTGPGHPENAGNYYETRSSTFNGEERRVEGYSTDNYTKWAVEYIKGKRRDQGQAVVSCGCATERARADHAGRSPQGQAGRARGPAAARHLRPLARQARLSGKDQGLGQRPRWPPGHADQGRQGRQLRHEQTGPQLRQVGAAGQRVRAGRRRRRRPRDTGARGVRPARQHAGGLHRRPGLRDGRARVRIRRSLPTTRRSPRRSSSAVPAH